MVRSRNKSGPSWIPGEFLLASIVFEKFTGGVGKEYQSGTSVWTEEYVEREVGVYTY